jgi:predicted nuclease of predicted toxin-antitoxin system
VRFLIGRCAGRRLAEWLRAEGHDVAEARERGPDPGDRILLHWASTEDRVLVTIDTDFDEFVFRESVSHAGLVQLPDVPASARIALMERVLLLPLADELKGAVVTVRGGRIRMSRPPPGSG